MDFIAGFAAPSLKGYVMAVGVRLKTAWQQRNIEYALFIAAFWRGDFRAVHHAMTFRAPSLSSLLSILS